MKKILLVVFAVVAIPYYTYGQDDTHVTVHVGEERLSELLTEEQKSSVTHLKVTGTLKGEDYAFLRENVLKNLKELNLRDTDIDTIPERALVGMQRRSLLVLPFNIRHIGYYAVDFWWGTVEVSGHFPTWERYDHYYFTVSEDNPYCRKVSEDEYKFSIYSIDGETLYYMVDSDPHDYEITRYEIAEGTKTICAAVFRDWDVFMGTNFIFPSSLDSIGDYAFDGLQLLIPTCFSSTSSFRYPNGTHQGVCIICEALVPPKLGMNVFPIDLDWWRYEMTLYVPASSLEKYKSTAGWCDFRDIRTING